MCLLVLFMNTLKNIYRYITNSEKVDLILHKITLSPQFIDKCEALFMMCSISVLSNFLRFHIRKQ